MPASNRPAEESEVRSSPILESNPVGESQPQPEQRQGEPENVNTQPEAMIPTCSPTRVQGMAEGEDAISDREDDVS